MERWRAGQQPTSRTLAPGADPWQIPAMLDLAARPTGLDRLTAPERALLARLKAELQRRYGERLRAVLLFGSRARGDALPDSDWDVAVVLDGYDGNLREMRQLSRLGFDLMMETGAAFSVKPFAPEELEQRTPFMHNLRSEGVPLCTR